MYYPIPSFPTLEDPDSWLNWSLRNAGVLFSPENTVAIAGPTGKRKVDIHAAYFGGHMSTLNQIPDTMNGIKASSVRWISSGSVNPFFDSTRQYCDVLLPCATFWEKPNKAFGGDYASALWFDKIIDPLYEAKCESWIAEELASAWGSTLGGQHLERC